MKAVVLVEKEVNVKYLKVDTHVRYWEDSRVNGEHDNNSEDTGIKPNMPCVEYSEELGEWRWRPLIDIDKGQIVNWVKGTTANVHYKVCDEFACEVISDTEEVITEYEDYVPNIMCPAEAGYGDYIIMHIDEDGHIKGWNPSLIDEILKTDEED